MLGSYLYHGQHRTSSPRLVQTSSVVGLGGDRDSALRTKTRTTIVSTTMVRCVVLLQSRSLRTMMAVKELAQCHHYDISPRVWTWEEGDHAVVGDVVVVRRHAHQESWPSQTLPHDIVLRATLVTTLELVRGTLADWNLPRRGSSSLPDGVHGWHRFLEERRLQWNERHVRPSPRQVPL
jgi:hypothetical protein